MNEFLYGDTLRWSFGFDNPNKAAVLFACLLPLAWWGWTAAWKIRSDAGKVLGVRAAIEHSCTLLVLAAPAAIEEIQARRILKNALALRVFLPEIDEDGRCQFWQAALAGSPAHIKPLAGMGSQIGWAWDLIVEDLRTVPSGR